MNKTHEINMLSGPMAGKIFKFALPLAATNILQQLFNSADVAVVGRFAGSGPLAAVGATTAVTSLFINIFVGLSIGANVIVSKFLGQNERKNVRKAVSTSMILALISGFFLIAVGLLLAEPLLRLMSTPEDIIGMSALYLKIYFAGMPFFMLYNFGSAILRSIGDTRRPLICLIASGILNILLNLFFVIVCKMDVAGVALATVLSNILCSGLVVYFLITEKSAIRLDLRQMKMDGALLRRIIAIGVPAGIQGMVFSVSNVVIQSFINGFGSTVVASTAAALNFELYSAFILQAFGNAATTFVSQNYGAGQYDRCHRAYLLSAGIGVACSMAVSWLIILFARPLLTLFTSDREVLRLGVMRIRYILALQFLNAIMDITAGSLRGLGHSALPAVISMAGVCGVRLLYVYTLFRRFNTYSALLVIYPVSWLVTSAIMILCYVVVRRRLTARAAPTAP
jgi:putative MATE family efflux protein